MTHQFIPGYDPDTDTVDRSDGDLFARDLVRITRRVEGGRLKVVIPNAALAMPWPDEYLWRPIDLAIPAKAWQSLYGPDREQPDWLEWKIQTADGFHAQCYVSRELVATDPDAWAMFQDAKKRHLSASYARAASEREAQCAEEEATDAG